MADWRFTHPLTVLQKLDPEGSVVYVMGVRGGRSAFVFGGVLRVELSENGHNTSNIYNLKSQILSAPRKF